MICARTRSRASSSKRGATGRGATGRTPASLIGGQHLHIAEHHVAAGVEVDAHGEASASAPGRRSSRARRRLRPSCPRRNRRDPACLRGLERRRRGRQSAWRSGDWRGSRPAKPRCRPGSLTRLMSMASAGVASKAAGRRNEAAEPRKPCRANGRRSPLTHGARTCRDAGTWTGCSPCGSS